MGEVARSRIKQSQAQQLPLRTTKTWSIDPHRAIGMEDSKDHRSGVVHIDGPFSKRN